MKMKNVEDVYPLSPMQQGMLFHAIYGRNSEQYFMQLSCAVRGPLDAPAFKRAWQEAINRHSILRTSFVWEGLDEPLQVVRDTSLLPWEEYDWTGLAPEVFRERLNNLLESDRARGFVLAQAPLMRVALIRIAEGAHQIVWSYHHLLLDGWSIAILLKEVFALYDSFSKGNPLTLERPRPYRDYIAWLQQRDGTAAQAFWKEALKGFTEPTPLGIDAALDAAASRSIEMKEDQLSLTEHLSAALKALARQHQLTVNSLISSAWAIALCRYSGNADIVYGMTVSGRPPELSGVDSMLGLFINTIPFRIVVDEDHGLLDWAKHLQQRQAELSHHGYASLAQIQQWSPVPAGQPLFASLLVSEGYWMSALLENLSADLTVDDIKEFGRIDYPLTLVVIPGPEIWLRVIFNSSRIDEATATHLLGHLRALLEGMVADHSTSISQLSMVTGAERQQILSQWSSSDRSLQETVPLHLLFEGQAESSPDRIALTTDHASLTYGALNTQAEQIAAQLVSAGVRPGDTVGILIEEGIKILPALIGSLKAGAAYFMLPVNYPAAYIRKMVHCLPLKACLIDTNHAPSLEWYGGLLLTIDLRAATENSAQRNAMEITADFPALVTYSSGCASLFQHKAIFARVERFRNQINLTDAGVYFAELSQAEIEGLWEIFLPLTIGARLVVSSRSGDDNFDFRRVIFDEQVTHTRLSQSAADYVAKKSGVERSGSGTLPVIFQDGLSASGHPTMGAAPFCVLDERMRLVPQGIKGELCIGGDQLATGHQGNPFETAARFLPDPFSVAPGQRLFKTGMLVGSRWAGELERFGSLDRKAWIDRNELDLAEIEDALMEVEAVDECAVLSRDNLRTRSELVAYIATNRPLYADFLREHLSEILPAWMMPSDFVFLAALPLRVSGDANYGALEQLPIIDSELAARWEKALSSLPEIEKAVVLIEEQARSSEPYDLAELLENTEPQFIKQPASVAVAPAAQKKSASSKRDALVEGPPLDDQPGAPALVSQYLIRAALAHPKSGITYIESGGSKIFHSYPELLERAELLLSGLRRSGLKAQDKVVFQLDLNQDFIPAIWGCVLGGFIPVPVAVPPTYADEHSVINKLRNAWRILGKPLMITRRALKDGLAGLGVLRKETDWRVTTIEELMSGERDREHHAGDRDEAVFFQLTSGSTGLPKCVTLTNKNITHHVKSAAQLNKHCAEDISLNWMPMDHVGSLLCYHLRDVYLGCDQVHAQPEAVLERPLNWLDWIEQYQVTQVWAPNFAYKLINEELAKAAGKRWDLSSIRFIMNGGEQVSLEVARAFMNNLRPHGLRRDAMHPTFGMAELSSACIYSHNFDLDSGSGAQFLDKADLSGCISLLGPEDDNAVAFVEVGIPLPGVSFRIADESNQVLPEDMVGRLQLRGDNVMAGYHNNPEANREVFCDDGWFNTGDLGFVHEGRLIITGREKEIIIINGANYYNHEVEACLEQVKGVEPTFAAACGVRSASGEEKLAVFFSPASDAQFDRIAVIRQIRQEVTRRIGIRADFVIPIPKEDFPKTTSGKIQRSQLGKQLEAGSFDSLLNEIDLALRNANTLPDWFYKKTWRRKKAIARRALAIKGCVLIFADNTGLAESLRSRLEKAGRECITVQAGRVFRQASSNSFEIVPDNQDHYMRLVEAALETHKQIGAVAHIWTFDESSQAGLSPDRVEELQALSAASLLFLAQALAHTQRQEHKIHLLIVSNRTQQVTSADGIDFWKAPMLGLAKTIAQEMSGIVCKHIDLPEDLPEFNASRLSNELEITGSDSEIAYRQSGRMIARLERVDLRKEAKSRLPFKRGGAYLITGGLGGIGVEIAAYLLKRFDARLILTGRTSLPDRTLWPETLRRGGLLAQRIEAYMRLEKLAGQLIYRTADASDPAAIKEALNDARSKWKRDVDGIIHLAGTFTAKPLVEETNASFQAAMRSKLRGTVALGELLKGSPEALFVTFSSVNGFWGGVGAGAYAAANRFLEAYSEHLNQALARRAFCLSWSMWDGVGMNKDYEGKELSRAAGFQPIQAEQGLNSFLAALGHDQRSIFIGLDGNNPFIRRSVESKDYQARRLVAYFKLKAGSPAPAQLGDVKVYDRWETISSCAVNKVDDFPLTEAGDLDLKRLLAATGASGRTDDNYEPPRTELEADIASTIEELLGAHRIGIRDNFFELGGHSLLATQLLSRLRKTFKVNLPLSALFEAPTVAGLAAMMVKHEASPGQVEAIAKLRKKIAGMSDDEVRAMLEQKQGLAQRGNP